MYSVWTKNLKDEKDIELFKRSFNSSKTVLDRLQELIDEQLNLLDRSEMDIKTYDQPNWAERQAHKNGARSALTSIKHLISDDRQITKETNDPIQRQ